MKIDLTFLGNRIFAARKLCDLTQQELAEQTQLSVKTIHDIERGRKNPSYETLVRLIARLGVPPNTLFPVGTEIRHKELQHFIWKFQCCCQEDQKILLNTLNFLAEQLLEHPHVSEELE